MNPKQKQEDEYIKQTAKELGAEWNSVYGHWELRLSTRYPIVTINPDEFNELLARMKGRDVQHEVEARIDELKELQMAPDVSDDAKDENYRGYIKQRVAQLSLNKKEEQ